MAKETIVLGVHDYASPHGTATVCLRHPKAGRILKKERVDNEVMDWYKELALGNHYRRDVNPYSSMVRDATSTNTLEENAWLFNRQSQDPLALYEQTTLGAGRVPAGPSVILPGNQLPGWNNPWTVCRALWTSDYAVAPDSTHCHIPGNATGSPLSAYSWLNVSSAYDSSNYPLRGSASFVNYERLASGWKMVHEWGLNTGNGTHRSVGFGSVIERPSNSSIAPEAWPCPYELYDYPLDTIMTFGYCPDPMQDGSPANKWARQFSYLNGGFNGSMAMISNSQMVLMNTTFFRVHNPEVTNARSGNVTHSGTSSQTYVCYDPIGDDLFLGHGTTIRRFNAPTTFTTSMTTLPAATNTYGSLTLSGSMRSITTDATHLYVLTTTHIYKFLKTTMAAVANWTHGHTSYPTGSGSNAYGQIAYDPAHDCLWVYFCNGITGDNTYGYTYFRAWGPPGALSSYYQTARDSYHITFSTTGTLLRYRMPSGWSSQGSVHSGSTGFEQFVSGGRVGIVGCNYNGSYGSYVPVPTGPSMLSHAVLGSDVVKTSSEVMTIEYEFAFT